MTEEAIRMRTRFCIDAAREAARRTLSLFNNNALRIETKRDGTPVTDADRDCELALRRMIEASFPDDAILGEEMPEKPGITGYRWIIDPIDGTKSFVHGVPLYGTLLAAQLEDESIAGAIVMPALDEYVYAGRGQGAWHGLGEHRPEPARVSEIDALRDSCVCTTSLALMQRKGMGGLFDALADRCGLFRGWGDCYAHLLVATGRAEAAVEPEISLWDVAPMPVIMREAGGEYTDWNGVCDTNSPHGVSSNGRVHAELLEMLKPALQG